jgi:hypothetical protein
MVRRVDAAIAGRLERMKELGLVSEYLLMPDGPSGRMPLDVVVWSQAMPTDEIKALVCRFLDNLLGDDQLSVVDEPPPIVTARAKRRPVERWAC